MILSLLLTSGLAFPGALPSAAQGGAAAPSAPAPHSSVDEQKPPNPAPEDVELLRKVREVSGGMTVERGQAVQLLQQLGDARLEDRLAALAKESEPERARSLELLRSRLLAALAKDSRVLVQPWPRPRLGCRDVALALERLMPATGGKADPRLPDARRAAKACLEKLSVPVEQMRAANRELEAVKGEAEAVLAAGAEPPPTGGKGG
jgi:hypothetical protein